MNARLLLITDPAFGDEAIVRCVKAVSKALPSGALCVQLRDKRRPIVSLRVFASCLRLVTRATGASLVINDSAVVARDVGADGVHLGSEASTVAEARAVVGRNVWVSVAAHSDQDVRRAVGSGADAVLVSPIFATRSPSPLSREKAARGLEAIRSARRLAGSSVAVYALGGVTSQRARACALAGADGVAVVRALLGSADPASVARAIHDALAPRW
jgi:thiamine-phosphate pyrophosphorylase